MVSAKFVTEFKMVCEFFGVSERTEVEAFKVLCRGNMDAAETFMTVMNQRLSRDPRYNINERIRASIAEKKLIDAEEKVKKALDKTNVEV